MANSVELSFEEAGILSICMAVLDDVHESIPPQKKCWIENGLNSLLDKPQDLQSFCSQIADGSLHIQTTIQQIFDKIQRTQQGN